MACIAYVGNSTSEGRDWSGSAASQVGCHLFLATLLDALGTGIQRALSFGLSGHLGSCLGICSSPVRTILSRYHSKYVPALCFSWYAKSSSSSSLVAFLGAFKGLALPPGFTSCQRDVSLWDVDGGAMQISKTYHLCLRHP